MIVLAKEDSKDNKSEDAEKSELAILKEKYNLLEEENKKLLNINATLLFQSRSKI